MKAFTKVVNEHSSGPTAYAVDMDFTSFLVGYAAGVVLTVVLPHVRAFANGFAQRCLDYLAEEKR